MSKSNPIENPDHVFTNGDYIRSMTDEEMSEKIRREDWPADLPWMFLEFLKQPYDESEW